MGGIAGDNDGEIENVYNHGEVQGDTQIGGIIGQNEDTLKFAYNAGRVTGNEDVGEVIGDNLGGTIVRTYFDKAGVHDNGVTGTYARSTAELKQKDTFVDWDFADTWSINEDVDFPDLRDNSRY